jgi:hypothetical protein
MVFQCFPQRKTLPRKFITSSADGLQGQTQLRARRIWTRRQVGGFVQRSKDVAKAKVQKDVENQWCPIRKIIYFHGGFSSFILGYIVPKYPSFGIRCVSFLIDTPTCGCSCCEV